MQKTQEQKRLMVVVVNGIIMALYLALTIKKTRRKEERKCKKRKADNGYP